MALRTWPVHCSRRTHGPVVVVVLRQLVQLLQGEARRRMLQGRQHLPTPLGNARHLVLALQR